MKTQENLISLGNSGNSTLTEFALLREYGKFLKPKKTFLDGRRLSCATKIQGDCVIDIPPDSQVHQQIVRKDADAFDIEIIPPVQLHYVEVWEPDINDPSGDLCRLREALECEWHLTNLCFGPGMLLSLQKELREGDWKVTVSVDYLGQVIAVNPGFKESLCGLAVDIGSTTVAAHLCNLRTGEVLASAGMMNPQIRFGEDLMSRVSYVMMHLDGDVAMTKVIRQTINELAQNVAAKAKIHQNDMDVAIANHVAKHEGISCLRKYGWIKFF